MRRIVGVVALLVLGIALPIRVDVKLPSVLAEHMVLQRDLPVHLWGMASPGELVSATFRGATSKTQGDKYGRWELSFPAGTAGGPFVLEIQGRNLIHFRDVLVGDVWLAAGQSNMEFEQLSQFCLLRLRINKHVLGVSCTERGVKRNGRHKLGRPTSIQRPVIAYIFIVET